jgi:hypothetical protein
VVVVSSHSGIRSCGLATCPLQFLTATTPHYSKLGHLNGCKAIIRVRVSQLKRVLLQLLRDRGFAKPRLLRLGAGSEYHREFGAQVNFMGGSLT